MSKAFVFGSVFLVLAVGFSQATIFLMYKDLKDWRELTGFSSLAAGEAIKEQCHRHYEVECTASIIFLPKAIPAAELDEVSPLSFEQAVKKTISYTF